MLCIIAGTEQQADEYARSINLKRNEYRYVWNPDILKGTPHGLKFVRAGTWYNRKDMREIFSALKGRGAIEISTTKIPVFLKCPNCGYRITKIQWEQSKFDYLCPRCKMKSLSEFNNGYNY